MFTGIIETQGVVADMQREGDLTHFGFQAPFAAELRPDESVAHNGVCLTVTDVDAGALTYRVTAVGETLRLTNLGDLAVGDAVNLERSLPVTGRLDGHFVQGHVDATGLVKLIVEESGSWRYWFTYNPLHSQLVVRKGAVAVNGVSLTIADLMEDWFSVALIPHTFNHTNFNRLQVGNRVNLEFDILGKYVQRILGGERHTDDPDAFRSPGWGI